MEHIFWNNKEIFDYITVEDESFGDSTEFEQKLKSIGNLLKKYNINI